MKPKTDINPNTPFLIGVAGGTASGKTSVCQEVIKILADRMQEKLEQKICCIALDSFYKDLSPEDNDAARLGRYNFDHPDAFDIDHLFSCLTDILNGKATQIPVYDFKTNSRVKDQYVVANPTDVIIIEGILVFYNPKIRNLMHLKLFVDTDADTRLARRVLRDLSERGREIDNVLTQYVQLVKPAFEEFCLPTKKFADIIVPRGVDNIVALDLIVRHIQDIINKKSQIVNFSSKLSVESLCR